MGLYQLTEPLPPIDQPVLIVALEGWVDAGSAATTAAQHVARDGELIAVFDPDALFDYRARRPEIDIVDGRFTDVTWPSLTLTAVKNEGRDLLVMAGHEPDYRWREFASSVLELGLRLGAVQHVSLGAIGWAAPHTRPTQLLATASKRELLRADDRVTEGPIRVPGAAVSVVDMTMAEHGIPTVGFWAQVPHYVVSTYAPAVIALLERLGKHLDVPFPLGTLSEDAQQVRAELDQALEERPEVREYVARLEGLADAGDTPQRIPTGDELAAEIEKYLRGDR